MFNKVFVVDDEKFDRMLYKRLIDKSGATETLELFPDAQTAVDALRGASQNPDLIFLDINMPRMNGFEFLEEMDSELANSDAPTDVAMLTTSNNPRDIDRAKGFQSVKYYISKPLKLAVLAQLVEGTEMPFFVN